MSSKAIGLLETRGLTALVTGVDAMLKSANVTLAGPMKQVGNALVSAVVVGDVAAVKAATDAGAQAARTVGEVVSVQVIPRPHDDVAIVLPKRPPPCPRRSDQSLRSRAGLRGPPRERRDFQPPSPSPSLSAMFLARVIVPSSPPRRTRR